MKVKDLFARDGITLAEATPEGGGVFAVMFTRPGGEHFERFGFTTSASDTAQIGRAAFRTLVEAARTINQVSHIQWVPFHVGFPGHYGGTGDALAALQSFGMITLSYETAGRDDAETRAQFIDAMNHATILRNLLGDDLFAEYLATEID